MPNPTNFVGAFAYIPNGYREDHFRYKMFTDQPRMVKTDIIKSNFVMNVRPSTKKYLKSLMQSYQFKNGIIINAVQHYSNQEHEIKDFIDFMSSKGLEVMNVKTSGHAGAKALKQLIQITNPRKIVPLIQSDSDFFYKEYPNATIVREDDIWC